MMGTVLRRCPALAAASMLASAIVVLAIAAAPAQSGRNPTAQWRVEPDFKNKDARRNLSGAACSPTRPAFRFCLAVNDDKKYAQVFSIDGRTIVPGKVMRLSDADRDPDGEGAAYDEDYFYITGSHGRSRNSNNANESSYVVFRFKVNGQTGMPDFDISEDDVVGIESSDKLRRVIREADTLRDYYDRRLSDNGANIEGIAVKGQRMYFGFRGPSVGGEAFILSVDVGGLFGDGDLRSHVQPVALGAHTGIRDLASVRSGLLILSGPVNEQDVRPAVFHFDVATRRLTRLAELDGLPDNAKAETLLVLEETADAYRVLIMFDGPENGHPLEYRIP
jgi:hypothetical protein